MCPIAVSGDALPPASQGLTRRRQALGAGILLLGLPALTAALVPIREDLSYATPVLLVLLLGVVVALVGGLRVALPAAVLGGLALNWFFTPPYGRLVVAQSHQLVVLGVYLAVAAAVSAVVDLAARRTSEAVRARAEAEEMAAAASATLAAEQTLPALLERIRLVFDMREVALLEAGSDGWSTAAIATAGFSPTVDDVELRVPAGPNLSLAVRGPELFAEDRRMLGRFAEAAATALEGRRLADRASAATELEAADRIRTALLASVGHDLRTPLAGLKAAVSGLRQNDVDYTAEERAELLATIEGAADRLQALVENLLDASRLEAGAVSVTTEPVGLDEVVGRVVLALSDPDRARVRVDLPEGLPDALADAGLTERVVANVLDNALRHTPRGTVVNVRGVGYEHTVVCEIVDHGLGVPERDRERLFTPFQRLGDRAVGGIGLGLTVAKGFAEAMGASLTPHTTHAGGLTIRLTLPRASLVTSGHADETARP